jgi:hypothetical protein
MELDVFVFWLRYDLAIRKVKLGMETHSGNKSSETCLHWLGIAFVYILQF